MANLVFSDKARVQGGGERDAFSKVLGIYFEAQIASIRCTVAEKNSIPDGNYK